MPATVPALALSPASRLMTTSFPAVPTPPLFLASATVIASSLRNSHQGACTRHASSRAGAKGRNGKKRRAVAGARQRSCRRCGLRHLPDCDRRLRRRAIGCQRPSRNAGAKDCGAQDEHDPARPCPPSFHGKPPFPWSPYIRILHDSKLMLQRRAQPSIRSSRRWSPWTGRLRHVPRCRPCRFPRIPFPTPHIPC